MNNKNKNDKGWGWRGRIGGLLVCALFAIGFGIVGAQALRALSTMLYSAWQVRTWQAVPAEVLESALRTSSDSDATTYSVQARYRYEWAGRSYESTRVGLPGSLGSDNIDQWHHDWEARLSAARDGGPPVSAWIDPQHPERAVLDRQLRWRAVTFMLPFALLFPLVAVGALYAAWKIVTHAAPAEPPAAGFAEIGPALTATSVHIPQHNALGLWMVATIVCVMSLGTIGMASSPTAPGWVSLIAGLFALGGLALLRAAVRATGRAWTYRGAFASFQPSAPRAGAAFQASWTLPPRAAAQLSRQSGIGLRVAQYRIDDSGSGTSEQCVETLVQPARPRLAPDGCLRLTARFELPADAPSQGSRRSGEKVDWRLEWLDARDDVVMAVPIPVQATAPADDAAGDRLSPIARSGKQDIPIGPTDDTMPALPAGVHLREQPDALVLRFGQTGSRWLAAVALVLLAFVFTRSMPWLETALLALALHAGSERWTLSISDDGLVLARESWLWRRRFNLPPPCLRGLYQRWRYSRNTGQGMTAFHALWARNVDRGSDLRLTPGMQGNGPTQIAQMLRWACAQRGGRFSPGELRTDTTRLSRPGWGWGLCLLWVAVRLSAGG